MSFYMYNELLKRPPVEYVTGFAKRGLICAIINI